MPSTLTGSSFPSASDRGVRLPGNSLPVWYFPANEKRIISRDLVLQRSTDEYFMILERHHTLRELVGHLGRIGYPERFFTDTTNTTLSYFLDYYQDKKGYFSFDGKTVYELASVQAGKPLIFILKEISMDSQSTGTGQPSVAIQGHHNVVANGQHVTVNVHQPMWKGDIEKFQSELRHYKVPAEDIAEVTAIVQNQTPDSGTGIPEKAIPWIHKMLGKALSGAWDITAHTAAAVLAEIIKGYYF